MTKTMRKMFAMAVLAVFILSIVPVAWAERGRDRGENGAEETDRGDTAEKSSEVQEQLRMKKDAVIERAEEMREQARAQMREKKELYQQAKEALQEKKEQLSELRQKARCSEDSEDCRMKKQELKRGVKEHLVKTIELIDSSLAKLQERVENSPVLTEEEKQDALARIATLEEKLAAKKAELQALADTATNEELRTKIRELKDLWHQVRKEQRWIVAQLTNAKQDNLVDIYGRYGERAEAQITKLAEQGAEVTGLQELLAKYNAKLEELKVAQSEANSAWLEAKSSPEAFERARELQHTFREKAKQTKAVLRELLQKMKEVRQKFGDEEEQENESAAEEATEEPATAE